MCWPRPCPHNIPLRWVLHNTDLDLELKEVNCGSLSSEQKQTNKDKKKNPAGMECSYCWGVFAESRPRSVRHFVKQTVGNRTLPMLRDCWKRARKQTKRRGANLTWANTDFPFNSVATEKKYIHLGISIWTVISKSQPKIGAREEREGMTKFGLNGAASF